VGTVALPAGKSIPQRSKRLLSLASDDRLAQHLRGGDEIAFEVVFERYGNPILSFCRHMLGSQEEAEDAVQHTFAAAYRDLTRDGDREIRLKPWLFTIARNRCLSILRARREEVELDRDLPTAGLAEQVERRAELRELLQDIGDLPDEQRAALLLAEVGDLSHADIGEVLDCEAARVKALVFRARSSLIERREARATPCEEIREQLSVLSGGSLRRSGLTHHLRSCSGCRAYRERVKRQRQMLAAALPVIPPAWLKSSVLGSAGGGGAAAAGGGGASLAAAGAGAGGVGATAPIGSAVVAKVAALTVLAGAGGVATQTALEQPESRRGAGSPAAQQERDESSRSRPTATGEGGSAGREDGVPSASRDRPRPESSASKGADVKGPAADKPGRGPAVVPRGSPGQGVTQRSPNAQKMPRGRGPAEAPPAETPVTRGPPSRPDLPIPPPNALGQPVPPAYVGPPPDVGVEKHDGD
jgi:RNA polymerase sigma factor (sigma-70 family)